MVTSHPRVLAVGECAQHRGVVHGIVAPIHDQAKVAAQTLTGGEAVYEGSIPTAKLKVMGIDLVTAGQAEGPARDRRRRPGGPQLPQAGLRRRRHASSARSCSATRAAPSC